MEAFLTLILFIRALNIVLPETRRQFQELRFTGKSSVTNFEVIYPYILALIIILDTPLIISMIIWNIVLREDVSTYFSQETDKLLDKMKEIYINYKNKGGK